MDNLRDILDTAVLNVTMGYNGKVGLLLSGGLDSLSVLLSCLDIGIEPTCYTFYLEGNESEDLKIFLISLKAGGTGLNLTSSDLVQKTG